MNYEAMQTIKTHRLVLRKFRNTDAECYYERLGSSENVTRYMLWQPHTTLQESQASIEKILRKYQEEGCYCWAIASVADDSVIGRIDLLRFDEADSSCSFAYMLGEEFWNRGYGTEALRAVFSFAFDVLQVQRITADHMQENIASGKVMQKTGMQYVGTVPGKYEKNGKNFDADAYLITWDMWNQK